TTDPRHITYAFIHAKVFVDYKTTIDSAYLIIRDGLIIDQGKGNNVPKDVVVYDLKGKCIYPSFIDIFSDYGMQEVKKPQNFGDDGAPQLFTNTKGAYSWNQSIHSEYDAFKNFSADTKKAEDLRKLGFGSVNVILKDGIARGTSVLTTL